MVAVPADPGERQTETRAAAVRDYARAGVRGGIARTFIIIVLRLFFRVRVRTHSRFTGPR